MEQTRTRILDGAEAVFLREGETGLTMRAVANSAGVGTMTTYRYFDGRDALLAALIERGFAIFERYFFRALDATTPAARLTACAEQYLRFALDHQRFYALMFSGPRLGDLPLDDGGRRRVGAALQFLVDRVREREQAACREISPDAAREAALDLWAHCHGLVSLHLARRFDDDVAFEALFRRAMAAHIDHIGDASRRR